MPFNTTIEQYTTETSVVDTEMNARQLKLVENDNFLNANKADKTYVDTQDTNLSDRISILSNDRGYLNAKEIRSGSIDNLDSGKYVILMDVNGLGSWGYLDVNKYNEDEFQQTFTSMARVKPVKKVRVKQSGILGEWKEIATTDEISILSNDRGYLNSRKIANMSEISASGKYHASTKEVGINGIGASCSIDATMENSGYGCAIATIHYTPQAGIDGTFFCTKLNGVWTAWKKLATTDKIDILSYSSCTVNEFKTYSVVGCVATLCASITIPTQVASGTNLFSIQKTLPQYFWTNMINTSAPFVNQRITFNASGIVTATNQIPAGTYDLTISFPIN